METHRGRDRWPGSWNTNRVPELPINPHLVFYVDLAANWQIQVRSDIGGEIGRWRASAASVAAPEFPKSAPSWLTRPVLEDVEQAGGCWTGE